MRSIPVIFAIVAWFARPNPAAAATPQVHGFEDEAPPAEWVADGGRLAISGDRYKSGYHALAWEINESSATLTYISANDFASAGRSPVMALWLYLPQPSPDTLGVELLRGGAVVARGWFGLNFRGWRPLGAAWVDLGWTSRMVVDSVRFIAPENCAGSCFYIDDFCVDAGVAPPRADDQQPWSGRAGRPPEPSSVFHTSLDIAFNRPWLPALKGPEELNEDDRRIMSRSSTVFPVPGNVPDQRVDVPAFRRRLAMEYDLRRRAGGLVGRPVVTQRGFWEPSQGISLSSYLANVQVAASSDQLRATWLDLVLHLAEQGFGYGSANMGMADDPRAVLALLAHSDELNKHERHPEVVELALALLLNGIELDEKPSSAPPDWPERMRCAFTAVATLPPSPQKLQRLSAMARCTGMLVANDREIRTTPASIRPIRDLITDLAAIGLAMPTANP